MKQVYENQKFSKQIYPSLNFQKQQRLPSYEARKEGGILKSSRSYEDDYLSARTCPIIVDRHSSFVIKNIPRFYPAYVISDSSWLYLAFKCLFMILMKKSFIVFHVKKTRITNYCTEISKSNSNVLQIIETFGLDHKLMYTFFIVLRVLLYCILFSKIVEYFVFLNISFSDNCSKGIVIIR